MGDKGLLVGSLASVASCRVSSSEDRAPAASSGAVGSASGTPRGCGSLGSSSSFKAGPPWGPLLLLGRLGRVEGDEEAEDREEAARCVSLALSSAREVGLDRHGGGCSGWWLCLAMRRAISSRDCVSSRQASTCHRRTPSCQLCGEKDRDNSEKNGSSGGGGF